MHARSLWTSHHADIAAAWQQEVRKSARTPWLLSQLVQRGAELGTRFADIYRQLQSLPRRVHRALQGKLARSLAGVALLLTLGPTVGQQPSL